jgi:hypothetical protein
MAIELKKTQSLLETQGRRGLFSAAALIEEPPPTSSKAIV